MGWIFHPLIPFDFETFIKNPEISLKSLKIQSYDKWHKNCICNNKKSSRLYILNVQNNYCYNIRGINNEEVTYR